MMDSTLLCLVLFVSVPLACWRCLNAWLQRPVMLDRSVKWVATAPGPDWRRAHPLCRPMDMALWAETVKAHVNCTNA